MNIIAKHDDIVIAAIGDIHEDYSLLQHKINYYHLTDACLFVCGDFGVGLGYNDIRESKKERKRLFELNKFLKKRNIFLYVVRGNHDNTVFFDGKHNFTNLIFMQDYDVVEIGEYTILGIGGATSVDRKPNHNFKDYRGKNHPGRKEGISWWPDEKVVYDEEKIKKIAGVDVIIAHTAPDFVHPFIFSETIKKWIECDKELEVELIEERALMTKIYNKLDEINLIKHFIYGHFHHSNLELYNNTKFKLLDIGEFYGITFKREENE